MRIFAGLSFCRKEIDCMNMEHSKQLRKILKENLEKERDNILSAKQNEDPKQYLVTDSELAKLVKAKGITVSSIDALRYHREALGFKGPTIRWREFQGIINET
ncbi:hypothetical protein C4585_01600 [Candidatus Parcubacteria bacterium]|nr:MAG: hypothetical protein C4585_01600 [Candidatus Parcubacteria bacterium]